MAGRQLIAGIVILTWLGQDLALAAQTPEAPKQGRLAWSELSSIVVDRRIKTRLTDGVRIEGDVLAVRPDALVLDITKTSTKQTWPKGQTAIPRPLVTEVRVVKEGGPFRLIGGILGTVGGVMVASAMTVYTWSAWGAVPGFLVVLPVMGVAGYCAGKRADQRSKTITIAPEPAEAAQAEGPEVLP